MGLMDSIKSLLRKKEPAPVEEPKKELSPERKKARAEALNALKGHANSKKDGATPASGPAKKSSAKAKSYGTDGWAGPVPEGMTELEWIEFVAMAETATGEPMDESIAEPVKEFDMETLRNPPPLAREIAEITAGARRGAKGKDSQ